MKGLFYTILELEEWNKETICDFCSSFNNKDNKAVCQIRTRSKTTDEIITNDCACKGCKEKFENDEIPKCDKCGRLQTELNMNILSGKYICNCTKYKENEKELPNLPHERRPNAFYERQINGLREELNEAELIIQEEREAHEDFMEKSEEWGKRQKQELLDRIKELEAEVEGLKKQVPQELINELNSCKEKIKNLEEQNNQLVAQIEVKSNKKSFLFFNKKS